MQFCKYSLAQIFWFEFRFRQNIKYLDIDCIFGSARQDTSILVQTYICFLKLVFVQIRWWSYFVILSMHFNPVVFDSSATWFRTMILQITAKLVSFRMQSQHDSNRLRPVVRIDIFTHPH
jgi:hypothetical protein